MDAKKTEIVICLGSSCFARGNKTVVRIISDYLMSRNLEAEVHFHGERCFGHCSKGPVIKLDTEFVEKIDELNITELLDRYMFSISMTSKR